MKPLDTLEFAQQLIRRASITPDDDGCQALMCERLEALGFRVEPLRFGDTDNFWARRGDAGPVLCFAGHTDVVPPGPLDQWSVPPFEAAVRDGLLYGRGAADMKGSLAAMVGACEDFVSAHPNHAGSLALLITSDEEGAADDGTIRVMQTLHERGEKLDWCVVGEPSSRERLGDMLRIGRRGSLSGILTLHGIQGHVAYPEQVRNPIHAFARFAASFADKPLDAGNEFFPPTSFQVVRVQSDAGAPNVVPDSLQTRFNFRYSTVWTYETLQKLVRERLDALGLEYELTWKLAGEPFLTRPGTLITAVEEAVRESLGETPELSTSGGTSDGRFIAPYGVDVVELGPVNATIHKIDEHVRVADLSRLRRCYAQIMRRLLVG